MLLFAGCQQTRSFLQMDSNSSSPFLGLQLSVDARDTQQKQDGLRKFRQHDLRATPVSLRRGALDSVEPDAIRHAAGNKFVRFADLGKSDSSDRLEYALPAVDLAGNPGQAAEVDDIMSRIAGS